MNILPKVEYLRKIFSSILLGNITDNIDSLNDSNNNYKETFF